MDRKRERDTDGQEEREGHRLTERGTGSQAGRERDRAKVDRDKNRDRHGQRQE